MTVTTSSGLKAYYARLKPNADGSRDTLGLLPATDISYTEILNKPGSFSVSMPLKPDYEWENVLTLDALTPGTVMVIIERDDVPLFAGIVWGWEADVDGNKLTLNGLGVLSYFRKRYLKTTYSPTSVEQTTIVARLIGYAQTGLTASGGPVNDGNIGVATDRLVSTGRTVSRSGQGWLGTDLSDIAKLIESFADNQYGFDVIFYVENTSTGYQIGVTNTLTRLGRTTDTVFDLARGVESFSVSCDGTDLANNVWITGSGEGTTRLTGTANTTAALASWPVLEDVSSSTSSATEQTTLTRYAQARLNRLVSPILTPSITLLASAAPRLGEYRIGDRVRVRGQYGILNIDEEYKLLEVAVKDTNGSPVMASLKLEPISTFTDDST
jgi:hypothetical protein